MHERSVLNMVPGLEIRPWIPLRVWLVQFPRLRASQVAENPDSSTLESEVKLSHTSLDLLSKVKTLPEKFVTFEWNFENCQQLLKFQNYLLLSNIWDLLHKYFGTNLLMLFCKLNHFVNISNICCIVMKRSSLQIE